ncbi:MarR family transcriptional regulator [Shewanella sp. C32]|uniref:MarR family transcriptional regulator n=1 Tax=Shewanella electrica TaxID=515560 RepID=A0ABT2FHU6_9GAMM|nr:MarR family transcriptional regulator [Shewanella electrica]MCS4555910.1 MarR family transcriptional regulator [Shewanella electrica]
MSIQQQLFMVLEAYKSALQSQFSQHLPQLSLSHFLVMRLIGAEGTVTPLQVAQRLRRDKAQITRLLAELVDKAWLLKQPHPQDRRSVQLLLTPAGEALLQHATALEQQLSQQMLHGMADAQQQQLAAGLEVLLHNLRQS